MLLHQVSKTFQLSRLAALLCMHALSDIPHLFILWQLALSATIALPLETAIGHSHCLRVDAHADHNLTKHRWLSQDVNAILSLEFEDMVIYKHLVVIHTCPYFTDCRSVFTARVAGSRVMPCFGWGTWSCADCNGSGCRPAVSMPGGQLPARQCCSTAA